MRRSAGGTSDRRRCRHHGVGRQPASDIDTCVTARTRNRAGTGPRTDELWQQRHVEDDDRRVEQVGDDAGRRRRLAGRPAGDPGSGPARAAVVAFGAGETRTGPHRTPCRPRAHRARGRPDRRRHRSHGIQQRPASWASSAAIPTAEASASVEFPMFTPATVARAAARPVLDRRLQHDRHGGGRDSAPAAPQRWRRRSNARRTRGRW